MEEGNQSLASEKEKKKHHYENRNREQRKQKTKVKLSFLKFCIISTPKPTKQYFFHQE